MNALPTEAVVASINGVPLQDAGEPVDDVELKRRAWTELLRQQARAEGLLDSVNAHVGDAQPSHDPDEAEVAAINRLLERDLQLPEPDEASCRRHYEARRDRYAIGERVRARHVLFAVTPGVDVNALRQRAEAMLLHVRSESEAFADVARAQSNCPSGAQGGDLGWLQREDCAPEFARELFGQREIGVLPRLVATRFGLHVVEVLERRPGQLPTFETVHAAVRQDLQRHAFATALRQYLRQLAGRAVVLRVDLDSDATPLSA